MDGADGNIDIEAIESDETAEAPGYASAAEQHVVHRASRDRTFSAANSPAIPRGARIITAITPKP